MKHFFIILRHELRGIILSASTYLVAFFFLLVMGFIYQLVLMSYNRAPQEMLPTSMFLLFFFIPTLLLIPLLTMRSIAEERRLGIMDSLLTTPINSIELVAGKFFSAFLFYISLYLLTLAFPIITHYYFPDDRIIDPASLIGGYSFICLSGLLFIGIGILTSALTKSQLVAGIFSFTLLFGLIVGTNQLDGYVENQFSDFGALKTMYEYVHVIEHMSDFSRGIIDSRQLIFYASGTLLVLSLAVLAVDHKR